jgi:hypothetical protein
LHLSIPIPSLSPSLLLQVNMLKLKGGSITHLQVLHCALLIDCPIRIISLHHPPAGTALCTINRLSYTHHLTASYAHYTHHLTASPTCSSPPTASVMKEPHYWPM